MTDITSKRPRMAYVFERFPTFTQTFCYREVRECGRQRLPPAVFSVRRPQDEPPQDYDPGFGRSVAYLPDDKALTAEIKALHAAKKIPREMRHRLMDWPWKIDKHRVYAAAWLGPQLRRMRIRHVHVHFAGIAARTAYWMKKFYGIGYSFTGHANDIFCEEDGLPVTLADLVREAACVATVSEFSADALRHKFPGAAPKIHRAYNGIDIDAWPSRDMDEPPSAPVIVAVGRYIEKKGFPSLVDACAILKAKHPKLQCQIVGEGPMEETLRSQIHRLGLQSAVHLTGPRSQSEILKLLHASPVFALPCVVERDGGMDNLPTVIIEAMACGLPCVSTPVAGVPEMIEDGRSGRIVPQHDPQALATALSTYLDSPDLVTAHGMAARRIAEKRFALPVTTRHLKRILVSYGRITPPRAAISYDTELITAVLRRMLGLVKR